MIYPPSDKLLLALLCGLAPRLLHVHSGTARAVSVPTGVIPKYRPSRLLGLVLARNTAPSGTVMHPVSLGSVVPCASRYIGPYEVPLIVNASAPQTTSPGTPATGLRRGRNHACQGCTLDGTGRSTSVPRGSGGVTATRR